MKLPALASHLLALVLSGQALAQSAPAEGFDDIVVAKVESILPVLKQTGEFDLGYDRCLFVADQFQNRQMLRFSSGFALYKKGEPLSRRIDTSYAYPLNEARIMSNTHEVQVSFNGEVYRYQWVSADGLRYNVELTLEPRSQKIIRFEAVEIKNDHTNELVCGSLSS